MNKLKIKEEIIDFKNRDGIELNGILHFPTDNSKNIVIILAHSGIRGRMGNTRQYVYYSRRFSMQGFHVFRFDPHGFGYSEGHIEKTFTKELYHSVQKGLFVNDTIDAVKYISSTLKPNMIILMGLCGGAITAMHTAAIAQNISGVIMISNPVRLDSIETMNLVGKEYAGKRVKEVYLKKMFNPISWVRLFTGKSKDVLSDPKKVFSIFKAFFSIKKSLFPLNPMFVSSLKKLNKKKVKKLFIFGSNDIFWFEYENEFEKLFPKMVKPDEKFLVDDANHMFTQPIWQEKVFKKVVNWVNS